MRLWPEQVDVVTAAGSRADQPGFGPAGSAHLLRPDGYVAAHGFVASPDSLLDNLHRLFGTTGHGSRRQLLYHLSDALCGRARARPLFTPGETRGWRLALRRHGQKVPGRQIPGTCVLPAQSPGLAAC